MRIICKGFFFFFSFWKELNRNRILLDVRVALKVSFSSYAAKKYKRGGKTAAWQETG